VMSLPKDEIQRLIDSGSNGKVSGHILGLWDTWKHIKYLKITLTKKS
jgi:hypothetical protein